MRRVRSLRGFTLTEVVVVMVVFSIGALGVFGLSNAALRMNDFNSHMTGATTLDENKIEDLLSLNPASVTSGTDAVSEYTRTWTVVSDPSLGSKTVTMATGWRACGGSQHQTTLRTVLYKP